jgi:hypothetical protein
MPPHSVLKESLQALLKSGEDDVEAFRRSVEEWYDDHMARVSGWYKRRVRWVSLLIGSVLVVAVNVNTVTIVRALYSDEALRESVVTTAVQSSNCRQEPGGVPAGYSLADRWLARCRAADWMGHGPGVRAQEM